MRFDDTLETVLAADLNTPIGVQSAWRQLVDLVGRRRVPADARAMARLRMIRDQVPTGVRGASARALEYANPPAPLVRLFALDDLRVGLPVLRTARMTSSEWMELLPDLAPSARAVLRNRRDLGPAVKRALESFGPIDFVLPDQSVPEVVETSEPLLEEVLADVEPVVEVRQDEDTEVIEEEIAAPAEAVEPDPPVEAVEAPEARQPIFAGHVLGATAWSFRAPVLIVDSEASDDTVATQVEEPAAEMPAAINMIEEPVADALPASGRIEDTAAAPELDLSFIALAEGSLIAPVQSGTAQPNPAIAEVASPAQEDGMDPGDALLAELPQAHAIADAAPVAEVDGPFEIAEVVARIDAFWRNREGAPIQERAPLRADSFRFETDTAGTIRWVEGISRAPVIGLSLDLQGSAEGSRVDGVATGAFRRRASFANARMVIDGESDAAGDWNISAVPAFDPANGRFTGYRGTGRRPRTDERAGPAPALPASTPADSLRQLVHELRTPTNAIAGFAEMIETQMLGPVADPYRHRASDIRVHARELLGAIDDLDLAARIDSAALALVPGRVALRPLLAGIADDLAALVELRGSSIALPVDDLSVTGDRRAVERLLARLMATLVSASGEGERICVRLAHDADELVTISIDRPAALADYPGESVLGIDDEREDAALLGTGFALRLARNLARELGGSMAIGPESLTLRLPAAVTTDVDQAHLS